MSCRARAAAAIACSSASGAIPKSAADCGSGGALVYQFRLPEMVGRFPPAFSGEGEVEIGLHRAGAEGAGSGRGEAVPGQPHRRTNTASLSSHRAPANARPRRRQTRPVPFPGPRLESGAPPPRKRRHVASCRSPGGCPEVGTPRAKRRAKHPARTGAGLPRWPAPTPGR
jgi:hypothetical protein